ncbi:MAG: M24 family metallopeptidase [Trueperaceae bacterium]
MSATPEIAERLEALRARAMELGGDAVLLSAPADVRWASGFTTPEDGKVVVTRDAAVLITDSRYTLQAAQESALEVRLIAGRTWTDVAIDLLAGSTPVVQADHLTWHAARKLEEASGAAPIAAIDLTRPLRIVKTALEQERLREAARLTDAAFAFVLEGALRPGVREVDVALALERFVREQGGDRMAFDAIIAGGPRSAMPHGVASARVLERGDLVTLDFGAVVDGYHADMTRAVALGPVAEPLRSWFDAVLEAQEAAIAALRPGLSGIDADAVARDRLVAAGLGERFVHSLGHGTGLEIHEGPALSVRSKDVLEAGMIVTIEPGVYDPDVGGLRIEDLILVTESGFEVFSHAPKAYLEL